MIIAMGEDGRRKLVIVQLEPADIAQAMRDCLIINSDTRERFRDDLEIVITGLDAQQLVNMMQHAGAIRPGTLVHRTDDDGRIVKTEIK